jgi:hypothetical protein
VTQISMISSPEPSEQLRGRIHRDDRPGSHDGDPAAQSLGLV